MLGDSNLLNQVATELIKRELFGLGGELFEAVGQSERAMSCYRKGHNYRQAVELARRSYPQEVIKLESEWGDHLVRTKQMDAAINHYIEAGNSAKAVEAAIAAKQWKKAQDILEYTDAATQSKYSKMIADHYVKTGEFDVAASMMIRSGDERNAVTLLLDSGKWRQAYEMAERAMTEGEIETVFMAKAEEMVDRGDLATGEELLILVKKEDSAIAMYKKQRKWDDMIRLVKQWHPDLLDKSYEAVGKALESENAYSQAEKYYVKSKDWRKAVKMYQKNNMWEDAYRIARIHAGEAAEKQIAFLWARALGGDSAVKLLNRLGHMSDVIDIAATNAVFDFAFELARATGSKEKVQDVHEKLAVHYEDEGQFKQAEENFIKANKHREAVLMYVHNKGKADYARVTEESVEYDFCIVIQI